MMRVERISGVISTTIFSLLSIIWLKHFPGAPSTAKSEKVDRHKQFVRISLKACDDASLCLKWHRLRPTLTLKLGDSHFVSVKNGGNRKQDRIKAPKVKLSTAATSSHQSSRRHQEG